jgi:S-methylmethionine-dependent homocysteine/selenocysteine methylase
MVNCAHPTHFADALEDTPWIDRVRGVRANASRKSHAELDAATELDEGDPAELADAYRALREKLRAVNIVGGCCGTDERHVGAVFRAWNGLD